jgi:hypothetical protein
MEGESELGNEVEGEKEKSMEGSWADLTLLAARSSPYYHPFMLYPRPNDLRSEVVAGAMMYIFGGSMGKTCFEAQWQL